ncbi:unnamed protein product [Symbiodinium necroappetens]|uniref:EF-hand domain-containing protein n=1 Tax=Symbiodinium necroappetens TaxID=1628268 RepID=A0A812MFW7_9DINO|nr:unnamed protein product [Symbiodinium necroappetens]
MGPDAASLNTLAKTPSVISFVLLCGFPPFAGDKDPEILKKVKTGTFEFRSPEWDPISQGSSLRPFACSMAAEAEIIHGNCQRPEWVKMLQALQQFWISSSITLRSSFASIDACAKEHRWQRAVSLADEARRQNLETRVIQYNATMNACAKGIAWKQGISLFANAAERGLQRTSITFGTSTSAFSKGSQWQLACHMLRSVFSNTIPRGPNRFMQSAAQTACASEAQWHAAVLLLAEACSEELEPSVVLYNLAASACQSGRQWKLACALVGRLMRKHDACANSFTYSVAISLCEDGRWQLAVALLAEAESHGIRIDIVTCNAAISACEKSQRWQHAISLLSYSLTRKMQATTISCNAAISACEKAKEWQVALHLLLQGLKASLEPTIVSYNATMSACEKGGQWQLALELLQQVASCRMEPTIVSYNAAISACDKGDRWQLAALLLGQSEEQTLEADVISFNATISACAKAGHWQEAVSLLDVAVRRRLGTTIVTFNSALTALEKGGQWFLALGLFEELAALRASADVISCNALISACTRSGGWERSLQMTSDMQNLSLKGTPITYGAAMRAKNLITQMLTFDPSIRPTAVVLLSPWLKFKGTPKPAPLSKDFVTRCGGHGERNWGYARACVDTNDVRNGDGTLSVEEIRVPLRLSLKTRTPRNLHERTSYKRLIAMVSSGSLDYTEFLAATLDQKVYMQRDLSDVCWAAFRIFDLDGDGKITREELGKALASFERKIEKMIEEVDKDGDGAVDFEEFCAMMSTKAGCIMLVVGGLPHVRNLQQKRRLSGSVSLPSAVR